MVARGALQLALAALARVATRTTPRRLAALARDAMRTARWALAPAAARLTLAALAPDATRTALPALAALGAAMRRALAALGPAAARWALAALAAAMLPCGVTAQSGHGWRAGERLLVTRFAEVGAVAADLRTVYAASVLGLERYDPAGGRWLAPVTILDGYPAGDRPLALAADPASDALWLATRTGGLFQYQITFGRWQRMPLSVPGPVSALVPAVDGLWLLAGGSWLRVPPGSFFGQPVPLAQVPPAIRAQAGSPLERAARADPFLRSSLGSLGISARLEHWPVTAAAPGKRPGSWWLGTWGGNLLRYDGHTGSSERLAYGLVSIGVSALARDGRDLWLGGDGGVEGIGGDRGDGGDGGAPTAGVTRASIDLDAWQSWEARADGAPGGAVRAILPAADAVWFAAGDGLYRLDRRGGRFSRLDERDGLPSADVRALAPAGAGGAGLWVGTRGGLALLDASGRVQGRWLAGRPVNGLARADDTLWVSSDAGLLVLPGGSVGAALAGTDTTGGPGGGRAGGFQRVPGTEGVPALAGAVESARPAAGALWAITPDALWRLDPAAGWAPVRDATLQSIGRPLALAGDADGLWVAGATGVAHYVAATRAWRSFTVGADLPAGPVSAVLPLGDAVWLATPAGAVRLPLRF